MTPRSTPPVDILAELDSRIAAAEATVTAAQTELQKLRTARQTCADVIAMLGGGPAPAVPETPAPAEEEPAGKAEPRPAAAQGSGTADGKRVDRARTIARMLLERGPMSGNDIAAAAGLGASRTSELLRVSPWFRHSTDSQTSPWELTEAGRAAVGTA